jgi:hypothetical protein
MLLIVVTAAYLIVMLVHDWVPLGPLNDLPRQREQPLRMRLLVEAGNVLPVAAILVLAAVFPTGRLPLGASIYLAAYIVIFAVLAWLSWYRPYLFGSTPEREQAAAHEFGRTTQVLPRRGTRIRPNLMHVILHVLFLAVAVAAVVRMIGAG